MTHLRSERGYLEGAECPNCGYYKIHVQTVTKYEELETDTVWYDPRTWFVDMVEVDRKQRRVCVECNWVSKDIDSLFCD